MRFRHGLGTAFLIASLGNSAGAYSLSDHNLITHQAIAEFNQCFPGTFGYLSELSIIEANIEEDLNFVRKAGFYSHYYSPSKKLKMRRFDSSISVMETEEALKILFKLGVMGGLFGDPQAYLGRVIHHLQDSASPPHVVPVDHGLFDGFESYTVNPDIALAAVPASKNPCAFYVGGNEKLKFIHILKRTATETLHDLESFVPGATRDGGDLGLSWREAFWTPSTDRSFGQYGLMGNNFGQNLMEMGLGVYHVPKETYDLFKAQRLRAAIDATKLALYHYISLRGSPVF